VDKEDEVEFFRTYSPQGDGNNSTVDWICPMIVFQNLFPARGRKPCQPFLLFYTSNKHRFSEPIPRKGTETAYIGFKATLDEPEFFRTYSPQGDGNTR